MKILKSLHKHSLAIFNGFISILIFYYVSVVTPSRDKFDSFLPSVNEVKDTATNENEFCLQYQDHNINPSDEEFKKQLVQYNDERNKSLQKLTDQDYISFMLSADVRAKIQNFAQWNTRQITYVNLYKKCPPELKSKEEILRLTFEIKSEIPHHVWEFFPIIFK